MPLLELHLVDHLLLLQQRQPLLSRRRPRPGWRVHQQDGVDQREAPRRRRVGGGGGVVAAAGDGQSSG